MHPRRHRSQLSGQMAMIPKDVLIGVCLCMPEGIARAISKHIMDVMIHWHNRYLTLRGKLAGINLCRIMIQRLMGKDTPRLIQ
jgi:hypothetical protein